MPPGEACVGFTGLDLKRAACFLDGCTIRIVGRLPGHPLAGRIRFLPRNINLLDGALSPRDNHPDRERLALILNLAATGIRSWSTDQDAGITILTHGSSTSHALIEACAEMSRWWLANRSRVPGSWMRVSPCGHPILQSTLDALDRDLAI